MRAQGLNVFALVDGDNESDEFPPHTWKSAGGREMNLFATRTRQSAALAIAPRLLELADHTAAAARLLRAVQRQSAELPRCLLIASPLALESVSDRFGRRFDVNAGGDDMMLRFWDSRIFLDLHRQLDPVVRDPLMAFGAQALASDRQGGLLALELGCPPHDPLANDRLHLDKEALKALAIAARPDAMLGMLRQQSPAALTTVADADRHRLAARQLDECLKRNLQSPRDQALALSLAIEHGPDWWQQEKWAACLQQARTGTLLKAYLQQLEAA